MPVAFQSKYSTTNAGASTIVLTKPTGTVDGDFLLTFIENANDNAVTTLAGWTQLQQATDADAIVRLAAFYKIASSEGANYTWTIANPCRAAGSVLRIDGQKSVSPVTSTIASDNTAGSRTTTPTFSNTITPDANSLLVLAIAGNPTNGNTTNYSAYAIATSNPSWTEASNDWDTGTTSNGLGVAYATRTQSTATGNSSASLVDACYNIAVLVAIAPPAGSTFVPTVTII